MLNLVYALKNDKPIHISEVERGLACGCVCPACGNALVAKKGQKMMHHFAHQSAENCEYGYETSLHLMAKELLSKVEKMVLPSVNVDIQTWGECIEEPREIVIDRVELEKRFESVIPDVVVYSGSEFFFVEIFVTHRIGDKKLAKLRELGIPTIEIDLSAINCSVAPEELTAILMDDDEDSTVKYWKYHPLVDQYMQKFQEVSDKLPIVWQNNKRYVLDCPEPIVYWNDIKRCYDCGRCVSYDNNYVYCLGQMKIESFDDLEKLDDECKRMGALSITELKQFLLKEAERSKREQWEKEQQEKKIRDSIRRREEQIKREKFIKEQQELECKILEQKQKEQEQRDKQLKIFYEYCYNSRRKRGTIPDTDEARIAFMKEHGFS